MVNQKVSDKPQVREIRPPTKQEIREALLIECAPREIDEADFMLTIIQEDPGKLTDNLFFELLEENPAWLGTRPFLNKIVRWQLIVDSDIFEKDEQQNAKKNISKISRGLLPKAKKGTPKKVCDERLRLEFDRLVSLINQRGGKGALLREYPELQQYTPYKPRDRQHRSPEEQAIHILVNKHKVSERTVRYALSNRPLSLPRSTAKKE